MINLDYNKNLYFISDLHFCHENIIKYCNRPFKNAQEMTEVVIGNWNKTITDNDQVIFVGDFVMGCKGAKEISEYIYECLNGIKFFIRGNHDSDDKVLNSKINWLPNDCKVRWVQYRDYSIALSHYPFERKDLRPLGNALYISGHTHSNKLIYDYDNKFINVCCEAVNYTPILFEDVINELSKNSK